MKEISWIERNERQYLKDIVPLETPLSVQIEPTGACNFKCIYCYHSLGKSKQRPYKNMPLDLYEKFINESKNFSQKYKSLIFCGGGEPLLSKDIYRMITLAKEISNEVAIITNGSLLTKEVSNKLIASGIDTIRISLQGLNSDDYYKTCGVKLDFEKFLINLDYLNKNKNQAKIVLKIPNIALDTKEKKDLFHKLFKNKCDSITIQTISPLVDDLDYTNMQPDGQKSLYGEEIKPMKVCPQIFYTLVIDQNGKIAPCSDSYYNNNFPEIGDLNENTIQEIWNSKRLKELRKFHLLGRRFDLKTCQNCQHVLPLNNKFDNLDNDCKSIIERMGF